MLDSIYLIIEDNGNRMTNEEVNRIGEPVNSTKKMELDLALSSP
jgi:hypothetical protein